MSAARPDWSQRLAVVSVLASILILNVGPARADDAVFPDGTRIVVAIRYLQPSGPSHSHLFLYSSEGKQLRQLTDASTGQDRDPVISPDAKSIVFRREERAKSTFWSLPADGSKAQQLKESPSWYFTALKEPVAAFTCPWERSATDPKEIRVRGYDRPDDFHYRGRDQTTEIVLKIREADRAPEYFPKEPWLHERDREDVRISDIPFTDFDASGSKEEHAIRANSEDQPAVTTGSETLDGVLVYQASPFIWIAPMRVALLTQHRGSSYGNATFAVDLNNHTLHEIAPTSSEVFEIGDLPALFCVTNERYLPLGDGKKTVNCSFLDMWNAQLHRTRFCGPKVAIFYGGCIWLPIKDEPETYFIPGEMEWR